MTKKLIKIKKGATLKEAALVLLKHKISGAPVVDDQDKLIGVISEKDLFRALHPSYQEFYSELSSLLDFEKMEERARELSEEKVENYMTQKVIVANLTDPLMKIGSLLLARGIHRVPVVEGGKLVGIVTRRDIYRAILKKELKLGH